MFEKIDEKQLEINRYRPLNHIQLNELKDYYKEKSENAYDEKVFHKMPLSFSLK